MGQFGNDHQAAYVRLVAITEHALSRISAGESGFIVASEWKRQWEAVEVEEGKLREELVAVREAATAYFEELAAINQATVSVKI